jgi:multidrug resistance protein, MATE family
MFIMSLLFAVPLFCFAKPLLLALGQDEEVILIARDFLVWYYPSAIVQGQCMVMRRWLNSLRKPAIVAKISILMVFFHFGFVYLFVSVFELQLIGIAIATTCTFALNCLCLLAAITQQEDISEAIFWPNKDSLTGWGRYFKVSGPATLMVCSEVYAYEILMIEAGIIGVTQLASYTVLANIGLTCVMIVLGI